MAIWKTTCAEAPKPYDALFHAREIAKAEGHPNVLTVHGLGRVPNPVKPSEDVIAVLMPFVEGPTLASRLERPFSHQEALDFGQALASGLRHIHERMVVHGDLHEENVLVSPYGPIIIDLMNGRGFAALTLGRTVEQRLSDVDALARLLAMILAATVSFDATEDELKVPGLTIDEVLDQFEHVVRSDAYMLSEVP